MKIETRTVNGVTILDVSGKTLYRFIFIVK